MSLRLCAKKQEAVSQFHGGMFQRSHLLLPREVYELIIPFCFSTLVRVLSANFEASANKRFAFWVTSATVDCTMDTWLLGVPNVVEAKCWDVLALGGCVY